ncbi:IS3 family transposase [Streptomyces heilongjiangensis]|uniref:IS3 family transposase n=1 Tax=Streptomyces heilongjiangensis TaxID=945052 RepID=A0ABW1BK99_9ACTN|nr:IS3 family transposase [Streptomyces heilongjiangensis]MDC2952732.1 IS3 family transposase [Streptomyces heilongjiangensis]
MVGAISDCKTEENIPYRIACRALGVSEAWFYKWRRRPAEPTKREARRTALAERIRYFFDRSGRTYGSPRITLDLWEEGWQVSQNTVAEIMAELGLQGRTPPRRRRSLTRPGKRKAAPDLVRRKFDAIAPDVLWWGDMTEIDTGEGTLYLASVHDAFSRRALGYAMGERHDTALVSAALQMAVATRGGQVDGVIFHTDRGSEYTSLAFQQLCGRRGVVQSMGRVGSALDNAAAESFHSVLKVEYVHRHTFATRAEARLKIATWIADFYNTKRRHSAAGGKPPVEFERIIQEARARTDQEGRAA